MTRRTDIGAAIIGSGFIGMVHIDALRRIGVRLVGLLEASPELGAERAADLGLPRSYATLAELLADPAVQVVHVTSPNELHHPQVKEILAAGRHVVCEKPLALTSAQSGELVALAAASGLVNAVNFNIRWYPLNQHVATLVAGGGLGEVRLVTGRYFQDWLLYDTDWNWRLEGDQGGALRAVGDIGSHWLDLTGFLTSLRVEAVMADLTTFIPVRRKPRSAPRTSRPSSCATRAVRAAASPSASSRPGARTHSPTRSTAPPPPSRGIRSSRTRCGSATATVPTSSCSATPRS